MSTIDRHQIGIDYWEVYLPDTQYSIDEYWQLQQPEFSRQRMESIWTDYWFEPEVLHQYFSRQLLRPSGGPVTSTDEVQGEFKLRNGIERVYYASAETSSDMAVSVGKRILARDRGLADKIDVAIYYHSTLDQFLMASTPCRLQYELGLKNAYAFAITEKGANAGFMALKIACEMLATEQHLNAILLIGSEKYVEPYQRAHGKTAVKGDSASAMIVRRPSNRCNPLAISIYDFPERCGSDKCDQDLNNFLAEQAALMVNETLAELHLEMSQVSLVIPPNYSFLFVQALGERLKTSGTNIYSKNIPKFGYLTTSDLAINLSSVLDEGLVSHGDIVLAINIDPGQSVGCAAFKI